MNNFFRRHAWRVKFRCESRLCAGDKKPRHRVGVTILFSMRRSQQSPRMEQQKDEKDKDSNRHINLKVREVIDQEEQTGSNSNSYVANAVRRGKE